MEIGIVALQNEHIFNFIGFVKKKSPETPTIGIFFYTGDEHVNFNYTRDEYGDPDALILFNNEVITGKICAMH